MSAALGFLGVVFCSFGIKEPPSLEVNFYLATLKLSKMREVYAAKLIENRAASDEEE
jgi:hypothetical protein